MKGFPNQIADLVKLATGMRILVTLTDEGAAAKDDGVFGEALVRGGVFRTGHTPIPVEQYFEQQLTKTLSNQSFRAGARGLRELYRLLNSIDDSGGRVVVTPLGRQAASYADRPLAAEQIDFWRSSIRNIVHGGGDANESHPYQVLLRLVARRPGISRAKCALALEARDDSTAELERIVALADLPEDEIRQRIRVTQPNWENAKKVLPAFAEQLGDVVVSFARGTRDKSYVLADAPGGQQVADPALDAPPRGRRGGAGIPRAPRSARKVTPDTIGRAGIIERFDDGPEPGQIDPAVAAGAARMRLERLRRHNVIVRALATRLSESGGELYEDPFDILSLFHALGVLVEVKTLDGTEEDERDRVRDALAQLLYYEAFVTAPLAGEATIEKVACFEGPISDAHREWLNRAGITVIWVVDDGFTGAGLAGVLDAYIEDLT